MMEASKTAFRYDPFSLDAMTNPMPLYRELRDHHPAYFMPQYDTWAFSRFEDCWTILNDRTHFSEAEGQIFDQQQLRHHNHGVPPEHKLDPLDIFNHIDPPVQTRLRQAMAQPFLKGSVNRLAEDIRKLVRLRLEPLLESDAFDFNQDFAGPVAAGTMCMITGIPLESAERIATLVNLSMAREPGKPGFPPSAAVYLQELHGLITDTVTRRKAGESPPNRLIDALLATDAVGRPLTIPEVVLQISGIVIGGTESLPKVITGGIYELWKNSSQIPEISRDLNGRISPAFEEMLRYCAPAQWFGRTVTHPVEIAGAQLQPGQRVVMLLASANRDPRECDDPDAFRWDRASRRLISFGMGAHFCIGIHVARLEGQIILREFLERVAEWECLPDKGSWAVSEFQIGWTSLPIRVKALRNA